MQDKETILNALRYIEQTGSQRDLAKKLGISLGKTNYIIKALIEKGLIKAEKFLSNKNKRQYKYLLTPKGIKEKIELTKKFIERKKREYEELQEELNKTLG